MSGCSRLALKKKKNGEICTQKKFVNKPAMFDQI